MYFKTHTDHRYYLLFPKANIRGTPIVTMSSFALSLWMIRQHGTRPFLHRVSRRRINLERTSFNPKPWKCKTVAPAGSMMLYLFYFRTSLQTAVPSA